jgi:hypothetical protein
MLDRTVAQAGYAKQSDFKFPLVFLDTDMLLNGSLAELLSEDFDVAVSWRDKSKTPINGGLIIINNTRAEQGRRFFDRLVEVYRAAYAANWSWDGDQFALRDLFGLSAAEIALEPRRDHDGIQVLFLPCETYNYAPENSRRSLRTRFVGKTLIHFKGPRKWMMPRYWEAHLAPLEQSGASPMDGSFNLDSQNSPAWLDRAEKSAELLAEFSRQRSGPLRVSDLGCGDQKLKRVLAERGVTVDYKGYDLKPQSADVEALDVERCLPATQADVAAVLGVM